MSTRALVCVLLLAGPALAAEKDCVERGGKWTTADGWTGCTVSRRREGEWTHLRGGGQLIERSEWLRGQRHGKYELWFDNCQIAQRGGFLNGL